MSSDKKSSSRPPSYSGSSNDSKSQSSTKAPKPSSSPAPEADRPKVSRSGTGKRVFSAYAQTWIGMTPVWLMGEALIPGVKVGTTFKGGARKLLSSGEEILEMIGASKDDVIVVLDRHFAGAGTKLASKAKKMDGTGTPIPSDGTSTPRKAGKDGTSTPSSNAAFEDQARKAAQIIRAAGEHAIVAVSSSFDRAQAELSTSSPGIKKIVKKHGKDVVILVDKGLKNPIVVTGVSKFAKSKGIPYSDALLRLASLGLSKIIDALPDDVEAEVEAEVLDEAARHRAAEQSASTSRQNQNQTGEVRGSGKIGVEEMDGEELERTSSPKAREEADRASLLGKDELDPGSSSMPGAINPGETAGGEDPYKKMREKEGCLVM